MEMLKAFVPVLLLLVAVLALNAVIMIVRFRRSASRPGARADVQMTEILPEDLAESLPYKRRSYLLSRAEVLFYRSLLEAVGTRGVVMAKVRLADVLLVTGNGFDRLRAFNRVSAKHVDFVVCRTESMEPLAAVELDDRSHELEDRQERDAFVDRALATAGLPLLRFKAATGYDAGEIRRRLEEVIHAAKPHGDDRQGVQSAPRAR